MDELLRASNEGVIRVDADGVVVAANPAAADLVDAAPEDLPGRTVDAVLPDAVGATERPFGDEPPADTVEFEEYYPTLETWLAVRVVPLEAGAAVYLRDVTADRERRRALDAREDELATLERINGIVRDLLGSLVEESDRERIEAAVTERLADSDLYSVAWTCELDPRGGGLRRRASAGPADAVLEPLLDDPDAGGLERAAADAGELRVSTDLAEDEAVPEAVRRVAFAEGLQAAVAVPLSYGDAVYGVLGVYTTRPVAFESGERVGFRTLGEATGLAINAAKQRRLLLSDTVVELTLSTGSGGPFAAAAARFDCTLQGAGLVPIHDAALLCFLAVAGADPAPVAEALATADGVADPEVVEEHEDGGLVRLRLTGDDPLSPLVDHGGTVTAMRFDGEGGRLVVEAAPGGASEVLDAVDDALPGTTLVSKRERERDADTAGGFRSEVRERLTDRQDEVLLAAFLGGYYDWPRRSTAEEVAESLDIASATLHNHLRKAERTLLSAFYDDRTPDEDATER